MSVDQSPYSVPNANLEADLSKDNGISQLPRFSAWWVLLLTAFTFGIYAFIWLYKRTVIINKIQNRKIEPWLINTAISLFIINNLLSFYTGYSGNTIDPALQIVSMIMSFTGGIFSLVWIFKVRNRLNYIGNATKGSRNWIGGILTFFFTVIYLQYKINQMIDDCQS
ncbi:DUF4234 domain-containing protein [Spartinivicinus ruber]|uniref:DUF4234 domain-containing protein n=1 Tax=Spartinivicinus ruber TaxID=2683272 RepID=UPI0013D51482|nr:DUF4234 domain-containing protein [Spartinivicinus ruber]